MSMLIERARRWREERKQRWLVRGLQMGREEGRAEGRVEGRVEGEREMVRRLVGRRFGEKAADDFDPVLADASDSGVQPAAIAAEAFACESVAELTEWVRQQEKSEIVMLLEQARRWGEERAREWFATGLEVGRAEGRVEGRAEGRLEGERKLVRGLVYWRISEEAKEDFATVLAGISDSDQLIAIAADVYKCKTAEELVERTRGYGSAG